MPFDEQDMYHGAALIKIAEHQSFTAINRFSKTLLRGAFKINASTGVYLKRATKPTNGEYIFGFTVANLVELSKLKTQCDRMFACMVCVAAKQICCIDMDEIEAHIKGRDAASHKIETQYQLLVVVPPSKGFRVYVNAPGVKRRSLKQQIVSRTRFPGILFSN